MIDTKQFVWAEKLTPALLKSPWWIGHIPFAYELIGRQRPSVIVELGTYSGSSFAAFCQAVEACGSGTNARQNPVASFRWHGFHRDRNIGPRVDR